MRPAASVIPFALAAALASCGREAPAATDDASKWSDDVGDIPFVIGLDAGGKAVAATGRPPMYYFTTTWCGYCKQMAATGFKDAIDVARVKAAFTPILLDGDDPKNARLASRYGVEGFPTIVFADAKGDAAEIVVGADVAKFKSALARLAP